MLKQILMGVGALVVMGAGYTAVIAAEEAPGCGCGGDQQVVLAASAGAATAEKVDVKNTKCIVMKDDVEDSKKTVEHNGKVYHVCCSKCVKAFNKDPEKYIKALEADPASFGVEKK